MTFRFNHRGSLVIDRRYSAIGRIRRASGTHDKHTFRQILSMLRELHDTGRHSVLREIRDGLISPIQVYGFWREGQLDHLPSAMSLRPITPTIPDWIDKHTLTETTKRNYKSEISRFATFAGGSTRIQDLPAAVKAYRQYCLDRGTARTFNCLRTAILSYLNNNFGKSHVLWMSVRDVKTLKEPKKRQAPQLAVAEAHELISDLPPVHAQIARAMLLTGMHWKEIVGQWSIENDRVTIKGTKAQGRRRFVPLIDPGIQKPRRASKAFRTALRKIRSDLSPYSFRRSFAHWMEEAGIPRTRRRLYLGHGTKDVTDRYERGDIDRFLREDAEALRSYIHREAREYYEQPWREQENQKRPAESITFLSPRRRRRRRPPPVRDSDRAH
jgi:hypothetical protein